MLRLTILREILRYVPRFRDKVFVIAMDGAVVEDDNFGNLLLDIALLRSLRIGVALVHGAGQQVRRLALETGSTPSNIDGTGVTDAATLQLALTAANRVTHEILEGLSANDLRAAYSNCLVAHPAGILQGIDHQLTGRVERVDTALLQALLENDIVPVIPPLGCDGEGNTYRLNSDAVAVEVARALQAVKLIYLTTFEGVRVRAEVEGGPQAELLRQLAHTLFGAALVEQDALARLDAEDDVLGHRHHRDEHEVLVHHPDPVLDGVGRRVQDDGLALDADLAFVRLVEAVDDVHQRRLAGAVLAEEGVHLAPLDVEVDVVVGDGSRELLADAPHLEDEVVGHGPAILTPRSGRAGTGPALHKPRASSPRASLGP